MPAGGAGSARRACRRAARRRRRSPRPRMIPINFLRQRIAKDDDRRPAPVQSSSGGGRSSGTMEEGTALGAGISMADRAVDAVMGPRTIQHETAPASTNPWEDLMLAMCTQRHSRIHGNDINKCQFYMDMLAECRRNISGSAMSDP